MAPQTNKVALFVGRARANWPAPVKYIGGGANGRVFETSNGRYMKIVANNAPQEWRALQKLQGSHLFPRFHKNNHWTLTVLPEQKPILAQVLNMKVSDIGSALTIFIMGRVGNGEAMTLHKYLKTFPNADIRRVQDRVFGLIEAMHSKGVSHGDLHSNNILVRPDSQGRILGMWAIDFGRSRNIPLGKTERELYAGNKNSSIFWTPLALNRIGTRSDLRAIEYDRYFKQYPRANKTRVNAVAKRLIRYLSPEDLKTSKIYLIVTDKWVVVDVKIVRGRELKVHHVNTSHRANVNMAKGHYQRNFIPYRENIIRNRRLAVAKEMENYKSPKKLTSPTRLTKSASPVKRKSPLKTLSARSASPKRLSVKRKRNNSTNANRNR